VLYVGVVLALFIGVLLGMLGGGGAILTLPMLVYVLGLEAKSAIATSLVVVGTTSLVGMLVHARAGAVRWGVGGLFGVAAMAGAYAGGRVAAFIPATVLLVLFGVVMVSTSIMMLRGRSDESASGRPMHVPMVLALGAAVGGLSGLVGAGGGFLIVPALVLFGGLPMRQAIGTSLLVIGMQSFAGFLGHVSHAHLDLGLVGTVTLASVVGSLVGATLGKKVPTDLLRQGFAWLVVAMGLFLFFKQLPLWMAYGIAVLVLSVIAVVTRRASAARSIRPSPLQQ
jgi:uncharacterized membrane protein YfcA